MNVGGVKLYIFGFLFVFVIPIVIGIFWGLSEKKNMELLKDPEVDKQELLYKLHQKAWIDLIIGLLPFVLIIIHSIYDYFNGTPFLFSILYGFDAMLNTLFVDILLGWPICLLGIIFIWISLKNFKKLNAMKNEVDLKL